MPSPSETGRYRNADLVLKLDASGATVFDVGKYEPFLDELCDSREYQKDAIRNAVSFLLGGQYQSLAQLARANYESSEALQSKFRAYSAMEARLQLPELLSASLDLATGTGKSYVLYAIATIMLAEGAVDRVLILCPSLTIERELTEKFRGLARNEDLRGALPRESIFFSPTVISANSTITVGSACIENYHAVFEQRNTAIRDLEGVGARTLVLNDEAHHIANETSGSIGKWKQFLLNPAYGFRYVIGVSGTCYVGDEYFVDVIYRYSLREAMEQGYVKRVDYVAEMPTTRDPDDRWQLIRNRHEDLRAALAPKGIRPLTIIVTPSIRRCQEVVEELRQFLRASEGVTSEDVFERTLAIYSGAPDLARLPAVDLEASKVEWIVSVSMLSEGWDVKRVFQIVPHEERAFNSKLLIAQVLGRGLRVPLGWTGDQPVVTVFNHDAWAGRIKSLVSEVLESERRIAARVVDGSQYHFDLHNIDYTLEATTVTKPMTGPYRLLSKGYVDLASEVVREEVAVGFVQAATLESYQWTTAIVHLTYSPEEVAAEMFERLLEAENPEDPDPAMRDVYTREWTVQKLTKVVTDSLARVGAQRATDGMKQKLLQSLGTLRRTASETVRYTPRADRFVTLSTRSRNADSVSAPELRSSKTLFVKPSSEGAIPDDQKDFFAEIVEAGAGYKVIVVPSEDSLKTPLNVIIADSENERRFLSQLANTINHASYRSVLKSVPTRFYDIDFAWKKGEHPKRGKFSPDIFIAVDDDLVVVVEIKGDEEITDVSEENRKKNEYAIAHFQRVNATLEEQGLGLRYKFTFLSPLSFASFFQSLRDGHMHTFRSELDVALAG